MENASKHDPDQQSSPPRAVGCCRCFRGLCRVGRTRATGPLNTLHNFFAW